MSVECEHMSVIIFFESIFKQRVWGGHSIKNRFDLIKSDELIVEA